MQAQMSQTQQYINKQTLPISCTQFSERYTIYILICFRFTMAAAAKHQKRKKTGEGLMFCEKWGKYTQKKKEYQQNTCC